MRIFLAATLIGAACLSLPPAIAGELKLLTTGAFKPVVMALVAEYEQKSGDKVTVDNDTAGALLHRIESGETFDLVVLTPSAIEALSKKGIVVPGSAVDLARVGIGVAVKNGDLKPDIGSVEAFKRALTAAPSVAYIDPAAGGSSGIYLASLFQRLGIADQIKPKAVLVPGGLVAERVVRGEAALAIHQISEILAVKGVSLVGPLPPEVQNYTIYTGGIGASARDPGAVRALLKLLTSEDAIRVLKEKGMERPQA